VLRSFRVPFVFLNKIFINLSCFLIGIPSNSPIVRSCWTGRKEKGLELSKSTGVLKHWFNGELGYGFIDPDDGGEAVFVHHTGIATHAKARALSEGTRVTYEVIRRKAGGLWAQDVCETG
jgi:CspA family cold shock protein